MTKANSTEIVIVVDRSGSMSPIAADMRGGFDTFIAEQRKLPGDCAVTLAQFDDKHDIVYAGTPIGNVPPLELVPRGSTALLDAIGRTIDAVGSRLAAMKEAERPGKVMFVIITDGQENASKEYNRKRVFDMITTQQKDFAWEFIYLGANQDAIGASRDLGIAAGRGVNFSATKGAGAQGVMRGISSNAASYRGGQGVGSAQDAYDNAVANVPTPDPKSVP